MTNVSAITATYTVRNNHNTTLAEVMSGMAMFSSGSYVVDYRMGDSPAMIGVGAYGSVETKVPMVLHEGGIVLKYKDDYVLKETAADGTVTARLPTKGNGVSKGNGVRSCNDTFSTLLEAFFDVLW